MGSSIESIIQEIQVKLLGQSASGINHVSEEVAICRMELEGLLRKTQSAFVNDGHTGGEVCVSIIDRTKFELDFVDSQIEAYRQTAYLCIEKISG